MPITSFDKNGNYIRIICKSCRQKKNRENLQNSPRLRERRSIYKAEFRRKNKQKIVDYLGGKCSNCGLVDEVCVYDLHHVNPEDKEVLVGELSMSKWEIIKEEVDKCILLCSNCHRKFHKDNPGTRKNSVRHSTNNQRRQNDSNYR